MRTKVGDVALDHLAQAIVYAFRGRDAAAQRVVELLDRGDLAGLGEGHQRAVVAAGVAPGGRDGNDLLMQAASARAEQTEPAEQHDAWLRAGRDDRGDAPEAGLKALADEARQQALDE